MPTSTRAIGKTVFMIRCGKFAIAPRADRGVRPYRTFYGFAENTCTFVIAFCAGGVEPRPYGMSGNFTFLRTSRQTHNCPTGGQRCPPLQDVLRFRRWCVQFCDCLLPGRCRHRPLRTHCEVAGCCAGLAVGCGGLSVAFPLYVWYCNSIHSPADHNCFRGSELRRILC